MENLKKFDLRNDLKTHPSRDLKSFRFLRVLIQDVVESFVHILYEAPDAITLRILSAEQLLLDPHEAGNPSFLILKAVRLRVENRQPFVLSVLK